MPSGRTAVFSADFERGPLLVGPSSREGHGPGEPTQETRARIEESGPATPQT